MRWIELKKVIKKDHLPWIEFKEVSKLKNFQKKVREDILEKGFSFYQDPYKKEDPSPYSSFFKEEFSSQEEKENPFKSPSPPKEDPSSSLEEKRKLTLEWKIYSQEKVASLSFVWKKEKEEDISTSFPQKEDNFSSQKKEVETSTSQEDPSSSKKSPDNSIFSSLPTSPLKEREVPLSSYPSYWVPLELLEEEEKEESFSEEEAIRVSSLLKKTLEEFKIPAEVVGYERGPILTRYEIKIPTGIKVNQILSLSEEIAMALEVFRVRIEAPIPGRSTIGIEVPNEKRKLVRLKPLLQKESFFGKIPLILGRDISGKPVIEDLTQMPHLLMAGATGAGKSVCLNSFILQILYRFSPQKVRLLLVDPKVVELSHYIEIPHLLYPPIIDPSKALGAMRWLIEEMQRRYELLAEVGARDLMSYNYKSSSKLPFILLIIDELGDLMMSSGKELEGLIVRLAQKARAVGIHLILATQRPSADVITALIKANCPARIAFQVAQRTDSQVILDSPGAEKLMGKGDMLFKHPGRGRLLRIQAPYISEKEVESVVEYLKKYPKLGYIEIKEDKKENIEEASPDEEALIQKAWEIIKEHKRASASFLQQKLSIGYPKAARIIDILERRGYIGPLISPGKPREILK